jgi:hypothetical protein
MSQYSLPDLPPEFITFCRIWYLENDEVMSRISHNGFIWVPETKNRLVFRMRAYRTLQNLKRELTSILLIWEKLDLKVSFEDKENHTNFVKWVFARIAELEGE